MNRHNAASDRNIALLRVSLGLIFLGFGVLKFVPGLSPAEDLAKQTVSALTFGLLPEGVGILLVATIETLIGLSLLTGRCLRVGLPLLGLALVGILSPLVLFAGELFAGPFSAPTLEGQYVLISALLVPAGLVVADSPAGSASRFRRAGRAEQSARGHVTAGWQDQRRRDREPVAAGAREGASHT